MKNKSRLRFSLLCVSTFGIGFAAVGSAVAGDTPLPANRWQLPKNYESEISAAEAYVNAVAGEEGWSHRHESHDRHGLRHPVIIDVRSIPEYVAGHPEGARNIPYPYIYQECPETDRAEDGACSTGDKIPQDPETFVKAVEAAVPNKDTPIYTLCRTGHRSVLAANLLTADGYTHVRNIWQGFSGRPKVSLVGDTLYGPLDLNHDGQITAADNDGWRYYQGLPYSTRLVPRLLYWPYVSLYYQ
jgi:rhodanese-related sulfurtransferase